MGYHQQASRTVGEQGQLPLDRYFMIIPSISRRFSDFTKAIFLQRWYIHLKSEWFSFIVQLKKERSVFHKRGRKCFYFQNFREVHYKEKNFPINRQNMKAACQNKKKKREKIIHRLVKIQMKRKDFKSW